MVAVSGLLATGSSFAAKESGEALEGSVGEPGFDHAELGDLMPIFAAVMLVAVIALWLIDRRAPADGPAPRRGLRIAVAVVGVLIALGNLFWVYRVGDSGAKSVWSARVTTAGVGDDSGDDDDDDDDVGEGSDDDGAAAATVTPTSRAGRPRRDPRPPRALRSASWVDQPGRCRRLPDGWFSQPGT